ncbi:MAG: BTAD domain-containing putative transcriptional regulator, partial [Acidimicrobiales bacterium]
MARPFRYQPPSMAGRAVPRPRPLATLTERWDRRVVTVVAGPGFGKTALLVAATTNQSPQLGTDVWLSCEPADESADHLTAGLAHAIDLAPGADLDAVLGAVWAQVPREVCIVLDDVHEIPSGSGGAEVLARLVSDLATNGHLVLASRDAIPVPLARVAAGGQLARVTEGDLVFDADELAAFAMARGVEPALLASTGGWPALAELTASAGADLVLDYLWEEVLAGLGEERAGL